MDRGSFRKQNARNITESVLSALLGLVEKAAGLENSHQWKSSPKVSGRQGASSMRNLQFFRLLVLVLFSIAVSAQVQNGQFTGTVSDPSGAAIPNAKVTVTNISTNQSNTITTNSSGLFTVKELPPATYRISAEVKGFKTSSRVGVTLNAGTTQRVDFQMELGQAMETIEVSGEATAVNIEDSKLASTVTSKQIDNLPLNGRNVYDLMQLAPGAVNVTGIDFENGHNTVVNGLREDFNGFLINGVSNKGLSGGVEGQA